MNVFHTHSQPERLYVECANGDVKSGQSLARLALGIVLEWFAQQCAGHKHRQNQDTDDCAGDDEAAAQS